MEVLELPNAYPYHFFYSFVANKVKDGAKGENHFV